MTLTVYHLKTCDTCRKAIKALQAGGHTLELVDVRADGVDRSVLESFEGEHGWELLLNRRSTTWRGLDERDKSDVTSTKAIDLMMTHPTLIKRPLIRSNDHTTIGWSKEVQAVWLI